MHPDNMPPSPPVVLRKSTTAPPPIKNAPWSSLTGTNRRASWKGCHASRKPHISRCPRPLAFLPQGPESPLSPSMDPVWLSAPRIVVYSSISPQGQQSPSPSPPGARRTALYSTARTSCTVRPTEPSPPPPRARARARASRPRSLPPFPLATRPRGKSPAPPRHAGGRMTNVSTAGMPGRQNRSADEPISHLAPASGSRGGSLVSRP
ncbi:hypothetical protein BJ875DRAFT_288793 [Amylocarpus encephaloides]|uniref:Uncharacterized protein n=1 Tax=Amylocarpus encephaloides TaxID=45428 RepID=A0A9P7YJW6_9HELO|nr:hypothetical protein BJ875DRAFT_288793 [Amylocarpus encephaloides]